MTGSSDLQPLLLGKITGVFGVRGWLRLYSYTEPREAILEYPGCLVKSQGDWRPVEWAEGKRHGKSVVARMAGVTDRETAGTWIGADIGIPRSEMPDAGPGQYYWSDLEGMTVVNDDGRTLGTVAYLLATGANDVLVVRDIGTGTDREVLIPFVLEQVVREVDLPGGTIHVDWDWD